MARRRPLTPVLRFALFSLILCATPGLLSADALSLRNGEVIQGTIVQQTRTDITINTNGRVRTVPKTDVLRIIFGSADEELRRQEAIRRAEAERREAARRKEEEEARRARDAKGIPWSHVWRSAVVPGWGAYRADERGAAYAAAGGFGGMLILAYKFKGDALSAKADYDRTSVNSKLILMNGGSLLLPLMADSQAKQSYAQKVRRFNQSLGILGLVYAGQLGYSFFLPRGKSTASVPADRRPDLRFSFEFDADRAGGKAGRTWGVEFVLPM